MWKIDRRLDSHSTYVASVPDRYDFVSLEPNYTVTFNGIVQEATLTSYSYTLKDINIFKDIEPLTKIVSVGSLENINLMRANGQSCCSFTNSIFSTVTVPSIYVFSTSVSSYDVQVDVTIKDVTRYQQIAFLCASPDLVSVSIKESSSNLTVKIDVVDLETYIFPSPVDITLSYLCDIENLLNNNVEKVVHTIKYSANPGIEYYAVEFIRYEGKLYSRLSALDSIQSGTFIANKNYIYFVT